MRERERGRDEVREGRRDGGTEGRRVRPTPCSSLKLAHELFSSGEQHSRISGTHIPPSLPPSFLPPYRHGNRQPCPPPKLVHEVRARGGVHR